MDSTTAIIVSMFIYYVGIVVMMWCVGKDIQGGINAAVKSLAKDIKDSRV